MELKDTVSMMTSPDYKERFRAEYWQTRIRYEKLHKIIREYCYGTLSFTPDSPIKLLREQCEAMLAYLAALEKRAKIEGVDLEEKP